METGFNRREPEGARGSTVHVPWHDRQPPNKPRYRWSKFWQRWRCITTGWESGHHSRREIQHCLECNELSMFFKGAKRCQECGSERSKRRIALAAAAHQAVYRAIKTGVLPKPDSLPCVDCGVPATDYDHRSYAKPLEVDAVCRSCNKKRGPAIEVRQLIEAGL